MYISCNIWITKKTRKYPAMEDTGALKFLNLIRYVISLKIAIIIAKHRTKQVTTFIVLNK